LETYQKTLYRATLKIYIYKLCTPLTLKPESENFVHGLVKLCNGILKTFKYIYFFTSKSSIGEIDEIITYIIPWEFVVA